MRAVKNIARRAVAILIAASVFAAVLAAGRSYLVCRYTNTVLEACCAGEHHDRAPAADVASCCDVRTHASPGEAVQPHATTQVASALAPSVGAPIAIAAPISSSTSASKAHHDWTGPPLDRRRATLSVFLL